MNTYPLYADVTEEFEFSSVPDAGTVTVKVTYEWGNLVSTPTPTAHGSHSHPTHYLFSISGDDVCASGAYHVRWGAKFGGIQKYFNSSFNVSEPYISESEFMDMYEDMNTSEYSGDIFSKAERIARGIIDTFCGQNFQYVGNKPWSKEGTDSYKLYIGKPIIHLNEVTVDINGSTEDYTDLAEVDWASKYAIRCEKKFPAGSKVTVNADWGWVSVPSNIKEAMGLLIVDILEDTRREHHAYGITRLYQDTNRLEFDPSMFGESTGNLDVDVLIMDYVYWIPDWI